MTRKTLTKSSFWLLIAGAVILSFSLLSIPMSLTSSTEYCMSCHEMERYQIELDASVHAVDDDNNPIECRQCHIPNSIGLKYLTVKILCGLNDRWVHSFGDPDNLERRRLQEVARRFLLDDNCRECHEDLFKTTNDETISEIGRLSHEAYLGINGNTRQGCAGCHFNMAHLPDFDRRYHFNAEFSNNLPLQEQ